jgi:hypothetical protein
MINSTWAHLLFEFEMPICLYLCVSLPINDHEFRGKMALMIFGCGAILLNINIADLTTRLHGTQDIIHQSDE